MKANAAQTLTIGWQVERFQRTKDIKTPDYWLKPTKAKSRDAAAGDLRAMIARMARKQEVADGTR